MISKPNIRNIGVEDLQKFFVEKGEKPFRAKQVQEWLWKKSARSFDEMTNISLGTRQLLKDHFDFPVVQIDQQQKSSDGTIKISFRLHDGHIIEGVLIPTSKRMTACISSQVGCKLSCTFCATGMIRYVRNLEFDEIYDQVAIIGEMAMKEHSIPLSSIVYMGMGEPLLNYHNVLRSVQKITSPDGLGMSPQRITISSVGVAPMIKQLGKDKVKFNFALSLHVANDEKRNEIIPYNRRSSIQDLIDAMQYFYQETHVRPTIEYLMLRDFNDSAMDARELADFCKNFPVKVNLIRYNPVESSPFLDSGEEKINEFREYLEKLNIIVNVRRSRGQDIDAACGQLANKILNKNNQKISDLL